MTPLGYRDAHGLRETTLWYRPFRARRWPPLVALMFAAFFTLPALEEERGVLRELECTRPGRCLVRRGSDLWGVRDAETFDTARVVRAELRRTSGKNPTDLLVFVDDRGEDTVLTRGDAARELAPAVREFFAEPTRDTLSLKHDVNLGGRLAFGLAICVALGAAIALFVRDARRAGHYRVSLEPGEVRVERTVFGVPRFARRFPLGLVSAVHVQRGDGSTARVVLETSEGEDFAIVERFSPDGPAHEALAEQLREALRLARG